MFNLFKKWLNPEIREQYVSHFGRKQFMYDVLLTLLEDILRFISYALLAPLVISRGLVLLINKVLEGLIYLTVRLQQFGLWRNVAYFKLEIINSQRERDEMKEGI